MPPMRWTPVAVHGGATPTIKNHSATVISRHEILVFGGYDGRRNHNELYVFDCDSYTWREARGVRGTPPAGRNGHTATLADTNRVFVIGGWLGAGPLAADDLHVLDIERWQWSQPSVHGAGPGPCNMHTADYLPHLRSILLFRGGDGREYLNDLHALDIDALAWRKIHAAGAVPAPRANHSSAVVGTNVLVFGGWDGQKRLNDIHVLDTLTFAWSQAHVTSPLPHPRAGMTFASHKDRIFLFGGSGPSAKCYNDLHIYDPFDATWIETLQLPADSDRNAGASDDDCDGVTLTHEQLVDYSMYGDGDANPNDNPHHDQIVVFGTGPGRRAGHSCSVVDRKLFVFGGSYGSEYLNDLYVLDTDPPPRAAISYASSTQTLQTSLRSFVNSEEFSDISFLVEGRVVYAHKVILSLLSERFRGMFTAGFREASQKQIALPDIRYAVFLKMVEYLYTGDAVDGLTSRRASVASRRDKGSRSGAVKLHSRQQQASPPRERWSSYHPSDAWHVRAAQQSCLAYVDDDEDDSAIEDDDDDDSDAFLDATSDLDTTLDLLVLADQFMLDHLKQICERALQYAVTDDTIECILDAADRSNALQLKAVCLHYLRNHDSAWCAPTMYHADDGTDDAHTETRRHSIE